MWSINRTIVSINRTSSLLNIAVMHLRIRKPFSYPAHYIYRAWMIVLLSMFLALPVAALPPYFRHYSLESGLSHNCVTSLLQDRQGFLWIGTKDGLNRFDGYSFKIFKKNQAAGAIGSNYIHVLHEDRQGMLWIGTEQGLYQYDPVTERFCLIPATANRYVDELKEDGAGNLWLLSNGALCRYNPRTDQITTYENWRSLQITNMDNDRNGDIWAGTVGGQLLHFTASDSAYESFDLFRHSRPVNSKWIESIYVTTDGRIALGTSITTFKLFDPKRRDYKDIVLPGAERNLYVRWLQQSGSNELWLGSEVGLYIYNLSTGSTRHLEKNYSDPYAISDNAVYAIYEDRVGGMWVGTFFGGLNYLPRPSTPFTKYYPQRGLNAITGNVVREIKKDGYGHLWIGTEDKGISRLDLATGRFTHFDMETGGLSFNNIHGLLVNGHELWIGTLLHGLDIMDIRTGKVVRHFESGKNGGFTHDFIYGIYRLAGDTLLVTTPHGAFVYNRGLNRFEWFGGLPPWTWYTSVWQDGDGVIWAGSFGNGVHAYNPRTKEQRFFKFDAGNRRSLSNNRVNGIFEDSHRQLWFTTDDGLCRFNKTDSSFTRLGVAEGFPSNFMFSILEDRRHRLWVSTTRGLACYDPLSGTVQVYTAKNGLLGDQFNYNSAFEDTDGTMYFGSNRGLISFHPDDFTGADQVSPVYLTAFLINQHEIAPGPDSYLSAAIGRTRQLVLPHDQSNISLDFASLNFNQSDILNYAYRLNGLSSRWVYLKDIRRADFVGLAPGTYRFAVKAVRTDGAESRPTYLAITILPPWWQSGKAYTVYTLLALGLLLLLVRLADQRIKEKNNRRIELLKIANEKELLQMELVKEKELLQEKINFFTNVAHEIKTPLTLIKIPLTRLLRKTAQLPEMKSNLDTMSRNTNRLLELTHQLLDFRQTEINKFRLSFEPVNITEMLRSTVREFAGLAEEKGVMLTCDMPGAALWASVDVDAFSKILSNLLGNAVKYASGKISVYLLPYQHGTDRFTIEVQSDGYLIPQQYKEKIFEPFFRLQETEAETGSGIGLALSRSLAQLHGGSLQLGLPVMPFNRFVLIMPTDAGNGALPEGGA